MNDFFNKNSGAKLLAKVLDTIDRFNLIENRDRVAIALSGGGDSVFLAYIFNLLKSKFFLDLSIIHVNHNLRGAESKRDENFSREISERLNIPFYTKSVDVYSYSKNSKLSLEEAARELRYKVFSEFVKENGFNKLVTAHNLDDLAETLFYRIFKGSGVSGLISIPIRRKLTEDCEVIRPLLFLKKSEIIEFLIENGIEFVFDSSNNDLKFSRNYIRNKVLPLIEEKFPFYREKIKDLYFILWEEETYWNKILLDYERFLLRQDGKIIFDKSFNKLDIVIKRRLIRKIVKEIDYEVYLPLKVIDKFFNFNNKGTKILYETKSLRVLSIYGDILFEKKINTYVDRINLSIEAKKTIINFMNYFIKFDFDIDVKYNNFRSSSTKIFFRADKEKFYLRNYRNGDKIKINSDKTKKLSDIFIDKKIPKNERSKALVLLDNEDNIVLVLIPEIFSRVSYDFYVKGKNERVGIINVERIN